MPDTPVETSPVESTTCCIVGGGPAGMVLALLLVRQGIRVTVLEARDDFDREFRGDTLHASVLENLDALGLAEAALALSPARLGEMRMVAPDGTSLVAASFRRLRSRFPFVALIPQVDFLDLLAREASRHPGFTLRMGANARELVEDPGEGDPTVRGVVYRQEGTLHTLHADLVVGADGRGSQIRRAAGFEIEATAPQMDVLWCRLPRQPEDGELEAGALRFGRGTLAVLLDRGDSWQLGWVIVKGSYRELRAAGIATWRAQVAEVLPGFAERLEGLESWRDVSVLAVETGRVRRWWRPGCLLLGDAAHVMSPIGGVGINYAIQDAVAAANLLTEPLQQGTLTGEHLARVQRRRQWPTAVVQTFQRLAQRRIVAANLGGDGTFRLPLAMRLGLRIPGIPGLVARGIAYGARPEQVRFAAPLAPTPRPGEGESP